MRENSADVYNRRSEVELALGNEETDVNRVSLNTQEEAVKRFVLSLPEDPNGTVLELDGRAVARVMPVGNGANGPSMKTDEWTEAKNARRCALVDKEIAGTLSAAEANELQQLQSEMLRHRRRIAPLPLDDARRLHEELLAKARAAGQVE